MSKEEIVEASEEMEAYFKDLEDNTYKCLEIAQNARKKGYDPVDFVEIKLAKNMAERVVGLISTVAPQLAETPKPVERIQELEDKYGAGDWRVGMVIAHEIALEKFCKFKSKLEAIEVGIRMGFAYVTVGVVSSPLEGFTYLKAKKRRDNGKEYLCINFSGPIRNAGGTAAAVSVLITDYVRKKMGYAEYDPDEKEIKRFTTEVYDYHDRVTNLQYVPYKRELEYLCERLPVEISGDPTEKIEVSNFKDLPRIPVNQIRGGMCLILSSCIPLKAPKLWKQLSKWGNEMGMEQWNFLEEYVHIQKEEKSKGSGVIKKEENKEDGENKKEEPKVKPDFTFIADLVAGRPVFAHPMRDGAFRLRYGRSRTSGYSAISTHPATMHIMNDFIAIGTQCKTERPGKAGAYTPVDTIEGPIVRLKNGSVLKVDSEKKAIEIKKDVEKILYNGDTLVSYGDFFNRAHTLIPPGYCEEWWIQDLEKAVVDMFGNLDITKLSDLLSVENSILQAIFNDPLRKKPTIGLAFKLSEKLGVPLHPRYTLFWKGRSREDLLNLVDWLNNGKLVWNENKHLERIALLKRDEKEILELLGVPHEVLNEEYVIISNEWAYLFYKLFKISKSSVHEFIEFMKTNHDKEVLELVSLFSGVKIKDKAGMFIGARLGRPEKAKHRKMKGSPHLLFPVGPEGGRMKSFQAALEVGKITSDFPIFKCPSCGINTILPLCEECGTKTVRKYHCNQCGELETDTCPKDKPDSEERKDRHYVRAYNNQSIDIKKYFKHALKKLDTKVFPDLIKGLEKTVSKERTPENLVKGILRAKNNLNVNKDGTIRYDCSEIPVTHFKAKEIYVSVEKLVSIGYIHDIYGKPLENANQIIEIKPQDIIVPCCPDSSEEPSDRIIYRTGKFIDELLVKMYGLSPFYNFKNREDIVGTLVIGLAPHTSAGILCRVIGFSKSQGFLAHPMIHAAMRRDCDGDESCFFPLMDAFLNFSNKYLPTTRGSTMDAPLVLTLRLIPAEVDDMVFDLDREWRYPLEFYHACEEYKKPWDVKIDLLNSHLHTPQQYEGYGFTHDTTNFNAGVLCSAYKTLPSMQEKLQSQMNLAVKLRCVDESDVARLVIDKHFMKDLKGNLRKYSQQDFRCVTCNTKYRRPPLSGTCSNCKSGKIIFTISEGSISKYLEPSISLAKKYHIPEYVQQSLEVYKDQFESIFGRDSEIQTGLGSWFENK